LRIFATQAASSSQDSRDEVLLEIQQGEGPFAVPVHRPIRIGETITLVVRSLIPSPSTVALRENEIVAAPEQYNMFVHSCFAADGPGSTKVELIDEAGQVFLVRLIVPLQMRCATASCRRDAENSFALRREHLLLSHSRLQIPWT
jgi:hypothetical protein